MPELNERDLHKLFHAAGHSAPRKGLADRIMARVSVTQIEQPTVVESLISVRGWITIVALISALMIVLVFIGWQSTVHKADSSTFVSDLFSDFTLPGGRWPFWMAGLSACLLFLALLDRALEQRRPIARH